MKLFRRLKNNKGIVLETSVLFMLVIFSLCFLLSGLTLGSHHRAKLESIKLEQPLNEERVQSNADKAALDIIVSEYMDFLIGVEFPEETNAPENPDSEENVEGEENNGEAEHPESSEAPTTENIFTSFVEENRDSLNLSADYSAFDGDYIYDEEAKIASFKLYITKNGSPIWIVVFTKAEDNTIKISSIDYIN